MYLQVFSRNPIFIQVLGPENDQILDFLMQRESAVFQ